MTHLNQTPVSAPQTAMLSDNVGAVVVAGLFSLASVIISLNQARHCLIAPA